MYQHVTIMTITTTPRALSAAARLDSLNSAYELRQDSWTPQGGGTKVLISRVQ